MSVRQLVGVHRCACLPADRTSFVWQLPELARFLMDVEDTADTDDLEQPLYLGPVQGWAAENAVLHVTDGAKRLTAIVLFLAAARDRLPAGGFRRRLERMLNPVRPFGPRGPAQGWLRLPDADRAWFERFILQPGGTLALPDAAEGDARGALLLAARFVARALDDYTRDDLEERTLCLLDQATFSLALAIEAPTPPRTAPGRPGGSEASRPASPAPDLADGATPPLFAGPVDANLLDWLTPEERAALKG